MDNRVFARGKSAALILIAILMLVILSVICGCGSKESTPQPDEQPANPEATHHDEVDGQRDTRAGAERQAHLGGRGKTAVEKDRRSRHTGRLREWTSKHLYMHLTLEHVKLSAEQLTKLAEINWKHFDKLQKKKSERPPLDEALLKMLATGILDKPAFEKDREWIAEYEAMREAQYRERMQILHQTLTGKQRTRLVGFVEKEQKHRYAKEDKRLASEGKTRHPLGCGGLGDRFTRRFTSRRELTRQQNTKLAKLRTELDKANPNAQELDDQRKAQRIFDSVVRKTFARQRFDASKLVLPRMSYAEPTAVSQCNQREFQALLEMLNETQRQKAAKKFQQRNARRRGDDPNVHAPGDGTLLSNPLPF